MITNVFNISTLISFDFRLVNNSSTSSGELDRSPPQNPPLLIIILPSAIIRLQIASRALAQGLLLLRPSSASLPRVRRRVIMASSSSQSKSIYTSPPEEQKQQDKFWQDIWEKEAVDEALPRFDVGSPSPALLKAIEDGDVPLGRAFVPGCGSGYDVTALAALGREVIGLEIAPGGVERARARLKSLDPPAAGPCRFDLGDFFTYPTDPPFDFIYDYTFLCALPLDLREKWAAKMKELLMTPGEGVLMTLIYPICDKEGGPPYKVSLELYRELLEAEGFVCKKLELLPSELCHRGRDGSGHWGGKSAIGLWSLHAAAADVGGSEKGDAKK